MGIEGGVRDPLLLGASTAFGVSAVGLPVGTRVFFPSPASEEMSSSTSSSSCFIVFGFGSISLPANNQKIKTFDTKRADQPRSQLTSTAIFLPVRVSSTLSKMRLVRCSLTTL